MKLESIKELWDVDCIIDETELGKESLRVQRLHSKYHNLYNLERSKLIEIEDKFIILRKKLWLKYKGLLSKDELGEEAPFQLDLKKEDLNLFIESDSSYRELNNIIKYIKLKIDFLESILSQVNSMQYKIKNAIEFLKFINGIN
jgi:hypothetical protein